MRSIPEFWGSWHGLAAGIIGIVGTCTAERFCATVIVLGQCRPSSETWLNRVASSFLSRLFSIAAFCRVRHERICAMIMKPTAGGVPKVPVFRTISKWSKNGNSWKLKMYPGGPGTWDRGGGVVRCTWYHVLVPLNFRTVLYHKYLLVLPVVHDKREHLRSTSTYCTMELKLLLTAYVKDVTSSRY